MLLSRNNMQFQPPDTLHPFSLFLFSSLRGNLSSNPLNYRYSIILPPSEGPRKSAILLAFPNFPLKNRNIVNLLLLRYRLKFDLTSLGREKVKRKRGRVRERRWSSLPSSVLKGKKEILATCTPSNRDIELPRGTDSREGSAVGQRKTEGTTRNKIDRGEAASRAASAARDTFLSLQGEEGEGERERGWREDGRGERERERALGRGSAFGWRVHLRKMAAVARFARPARRWILFSFSRESERGSR